MSDDTMDASIRELAETVVGHRIVGAEQSPERGAKVTLTLDSGQRVIVHDTSACCAYTEVDSLKFYAENADNVITSVITDGKYEKWHVYAAGIPVLDMNVSWSEGSGYYGYGFDIWVEESNND